MNIEKIKDRMLDRKMSPEALAVKMGRCISTVQNMLRGNFASYETLYLASKALDLSMKEIDPKRKPGEKRVKKRNYSHYDKPRAA